MSLPHFSESEYAVLGSVLIDPDCFHNLDGFVLDTDFFRPANQRIWRAYRGITARGGLIDPPAVVEELRRAGELEAAGGASYVGELLDVPSAANVEYHARQVREAATLRALIRAAEGVIEDAKKLADPPDQILGRAYSQLLNVGTSRQADTMVSTKDMLLPVLGFIERAEDPPMVQSGIGTLDDVVTFGVGDLTYAAGRPGMGKTALMGTLCLNAGACGIPTLVLSMEMTKEQLMLRMLSHESGVPFWRLLKRRMRDEDYAPLNKGAGIVDRMPIIMDESSGLSLPEVQSRVHRFRASYARDAELALVAIDYVQLMRGRGENRNQEISEISRGLKALAKNTRTHIFAVSQLSRGPELRANHRPLLSDLRESGSLEQDADIVIFPFRPEYYAENETEKIALRDKAEIIIAKQRNGPTGTARAFYREEILRWESARAMGVAA